MNVQAEVSLYPLRTQNLGRPIDGFLDGLHAAGLTVEPGRMSSTVQGDVETVFTTLGNAFRDAAEEHQVVLILKVSNACPSGRETENE
jgi:uncharacterized protein YqgV (UPF0045/DUF77 family)